MGSDAPQINAANYKRQAREKKIILKYERTTTKKLEKKRYLKMIVS